MAVTRSPRVVPRHHDNVVQFLPTYFIREMPVPYGATDQCVTWKDALTMALSPSLLVCYVMCGVEREQTRQSLTVYPWPPETEHRTYQITLCGHGDQDKVVTDPNLLSLRALLGGRMNRPPAGLALGNLLQADVKRQLIRRRAAG